MKLVFRVFHTHKMGHKLAIEICFMGDKQPLEMDFEAPEYVKLLDMAIKCLQELKKKAESVKVLEEGKTEQN